MFLFPVSNLHTSGCNRIHLQNPPEDSWLLRCQDYIGLDRHGRPILLERVGAWIIDSVLEVTKDLEEFRVLHAMCYEILRQMERPEGVKDPRGIVLVIDLEGMLGTRGVGMVPV